jgi:hypothetical protein
MTTLSAERWQLCAIMEPMGSSDEAKARTAKAARTFTRLTGQLAAARAELAASVIAERLEGEKIEDITARVPYRQTQVNRILEAAGLTEKRPRRNAMPDTIGEMGRNTREQIFGAGPRKWETPADQQ